MTSFVRMGSIDWETMLRIKVQGGRVCNKPNTKLLCEVHRASFIRMGSIDWATILRSLGLGDGGSVGQLRLLGS